MKGFITKMLRTACGLGLLGMTGCFGYYDLVDPCYPARYDSMARHEVYDAFKPQVVNGHILDQTVWNYHFEAGTDKLLPGGMDHLAYLARRRPCPDTTIYLQTAQDIPYDPDHPEKFPEMRCELDTKRIQAIQKYLTAITCGSKPFQVCVHNPADPGISAIPMNLAVQRMYSGATGILSGGAGAAAGASGGGGASSAGGASAAAGR
jgi:uncharacterized membrane protein YgcG